MSLGKDFLNQALSQPLTAAGITLTDEDTNLLREITLGGVVRGSVAMRRARLSPAKMLEATKHLVTSGLVTVEGDVNDDVMVQYAMFSPNRNTLALVEHGLNIQKAL